MWLQICKEHLDRICAFLLESSGVAFCDECLRTALEVTRIIVPERNLAEMAAARGFVRGQGMCACCGARRVTSTAIAHKH